MNEPQAHRALALLQRKQLHGTIITRGAQHVIECQFACFTSIRAFERWLKGQPTWRERIDLIQAELARLQAQEVEAVIRE